MSRDQICFSFCQPCTCHCQQPLKRPNYIFVRIASRQGNSVSSNTGVKMGGWMEVLSMLKMFFVDDIFVVFGP